MKWKAIPAECPHCKKQGSLSDFVFEAEFVVDDDEETPNHETTVNKILKAIDKTLLMGAAFDCMSDDSKEKFRHKLEKIIRKAS